MYEIPDSVRVLLDIESRQDEVLRQLVELDERLERVLADCWAFCRSGRGAAALPEAAGAAGLPDAAAAAVPPGAATAAVPPGAAAFELPGGPSIAAVEVA